MATRPMSEEPRITTLPISTVPALLRAVTDPEGTGDMTPREREMIEQVERNVAAMTDGAQSNSC